MKYSILTILISLSLPLAGCVELFAGGAGSGGTGPQPIDIGAGEPTSPVIATELIVLDSSLRTQTCGVLSRELSVTKSNQENKLRATFTASVTNTSATTVVDKQTGCTSFSLKNAAGVEQILTSTSSCGTKADEQHTKHYPPNQTTKYITHWQPKEKGMYRLNFTHQATTETGQTCPNIYLDIKVQ